MSALRQSVPDWCFFRQQDDPRSYYRRLREIGYGGVEMVDPARQPAARAAGLEIVNLAAPGMQEGFNRLDRHATLLPRIRAAVSEAAAEGIGQVIVFSGNRGALSPEEGMRNCALALKELAGAAERSRVTLVFEMLNGHDHPDYQADSSAFGFEVVRAVGSPAVKVLYDVYHLHRMGEDLLRPLLRNLELVAHIHVAGSPRRDFPGPDQAIDYARLVARVQAAGFRGYWGQEFVPRGDPFAELEAAGRLFESFVQPAGSGNRD